MITVRSATVVLLAAGFLTGCSSHHSAPAPAPVTGSHDDGPAQTRVTGSLLLTGGPAGASPEGVPGRVTFEADTGARKTTDADPAGAFTITLSPGRYTVAGSSTQFPGSCAADGPVTVPSGGLTGVKVACSRK